MTTPYLIAARQGIIFVGHAHPDSGRGCLRRDRGRTRSAVAMTTLGSVSDNGPVAADQFVGLLLGGAMRTEIMNGVAQGWLGVPSGHVQK